MIALAKGSNVGKKEEVKGALMERSVSVPTARRDDTGLEGAGNALGSINASVNILVAFGLHSSQDVSDTVAQQVEAPAQPSLSLAEDVQEPAGEEDDDEEEDEEEEEVPDDLAHLSPEAQQRAIKIRAAWQMTLGTLLVLIFSDPMVDCLSALGTRLGLKTPFYVSFVLAPMASNAVRPGHSPTFTRRRAGLSFWVVL